MPTSDTHWLIPFTLCLALLGCGSDEPDAKPSITPPETNTAPPDAELVIEASEPTLMRDGESINAMAVVESIFTETDDLVSPAFHAQLDRSFDRQGQRLIWITMNNPFTPNQEKLDQAADELFASLKSKFEDYAKQALADEVTRQQSLAEAAKQEVVKLQQTLRSFQESRRDLPATSDSRLERRKLDRQIENALNIQITANQRVEVLQRKVMREAHAKLVRVR